MLYRYCMGGETAVGGLACCFFCCFLGFNKLHCRNCDKTKAKQRNPPLQEPISTLQYPVEFRIQLKKRRNAVPERNLPHSIRIFSSARTCTACRTHNLHNLILHTPRGGGGSSWSFQHDRIPPTDRRLRSPPPPFTDAHFPTGGAEQKKQQAPRARKAPLRASSPSPPPPTPIHRFGTKPSPPCSVCPAR